MNEETANRIIDLIETIGSAAARDGFALATRHAYLDGVLATGFGSAILLACVFLFVWGVKRDGLGYDGDGAVAILVSTAAFMVNLFVLYSGIMHIMIPEWYAVEALFRLITSGS